MALHDDFKTVTETLRESKSFIIASSNDEQTCCTTAQHIREELFYIPSGIALQITAEYIGTSNTFVRGVVKLIAYG
jgi:hypothetical protein